MVFCLGKYRINSLSVSLFVTCLMESEGINVLTNSLTSLVTSLLILFYSFICLFVCVHPHMCLPACMCTTCTQYLRRTEGCPKRCYKLNSGPLPENLFGLWAVTPAPNLTLFHMFHDYYAHSHVFHDYYTCALKLIFAIGIKWEKKVLK